jgi:ppGpp synthetase/RelA/SpoT-type nucleotidyltranferase
VIADFVARRPDYEQLCAEVRYILEKRLRAEGIEVASITSRAKTLTSFLEKVGREARRDPLSEITDLAGARVVCLYRSDLATIEQVIREQFQVKEKVDKLEEQGADRFGYGAVHYVVSLGKRSSGARYDDLKGLLCEIQTRTVAQDAWAIISHHLLYKHESAVPSTLRRKLNSLAGVFETADDQFEALRLQREAYLREIEEKAAEPSGQELNLDTLSAYLRWKYPALAQPSGDVLSYFLQFLHGEGYTTVGDIDTRMARAAPALEQLARDRSPRPDPNVLDYVLWGLWLADRKVRRHMLWERDTQEALEKHDPLAPEDA